MRRVGVLGGGAWGTALAQVCARAGLEPLILAHESEVVASINAGAGNDVLHRSACIAADRELLMGGVQQLPASELLLPFTQRRGRCA